MTVMPSAPTETVLGGNGLVAGPCFTSPVAMSFRTLEEVGREFGITRERIRQIEAKALRKLRHPSYSRKLRGYLE